MSDAARDRPARNPLDHLLRTDRMPHIWCPGCGIGTVLKALLDAIVESALPEDDLAVVSGIGCTARVPGYLRLDSFHTTHGRSLPYATGLHLANPRLKVMVVSGDGDLFAIGGNHFIHAARRNVDLLVVCVNNFTYGMTGGQAGPTTPTGHKSTTTPAGNLETPFNLPNLAAAAGAVLRRALDDAARAPAAGDDPRGARQARLPLHRGHRPLPHRLRAAQQDGRGGST